ncbi:uncharacterized protein LOC130951953 isoform X3 [Arachis stenosperma]|uniref:uncharacterized protein LOC130951953 isoform X3 n=1 Tax=Arachis stenosperma TaxID=217475 RepID=UPI0025AB7B5E|nr:uncharacterized protein LOC130951953 isoform X3 [Arachis stenosperma]
MDKVVYIYVLLGLFAASIFSSCICGTSTKFETHGDCNLFGSIAEKSVSNAIETIYIGILVLGIKFVNNLFSICYKESASYTMREMEEGDGKESPTNSQQTVSDDDEIDYTTKPEFYDPDLDDKDEKWVQKKRQQCGSDAVLSCPACFTTLCLQCQRHEKYVTRYRAVFAVNCKINDDNILMEDTPRSRKRNRGGAGRSDGQEATSANNETFKQVCCSVCSTEVGVIDEDEVYHFFNVLPSES